MGCKTLCRSSCSSKSYCEDPLSEDEEYALSQGGPKKIKLPKERIDAAISFMKIAAKLVIEDHFDRKFLTLKFLKNV